jgi:hypothetical protein
MSIKYTKYFPFQGTPKYTQIVIVGMKIYHLATLLDAHTELFFIEN